ncbi:glycosyltransferase family 39 protein [bacterium]|nr:glycosyltransferase family 39 protein [bacterium]
MQIDGESTGVPDAAAITGRAADRRAMLVIAAAFAISRVAYFLAGVRFDVSTLAWYWQYIDPALLRDDLLSSLWHLVTQPPLFNLFLGLVLKIAGGAAPLAFASIYKFAGLAGAIALFALARRLGASRSAALAAALVFSLSPAYVLYENYLFYSLPIALTLVAAAWFLHRAVARGCSKNALAFSGLCAGIALTRSLFILPWMLAAIFLLVAATRDHAPERKKRMAIAASLPFLLVFGWYAKNLAMYGEFTASAWLGMNMANAITVRVPKEVRLELAKAGAISPVSLIYPFNPISVYARVLPPPPLTDVPLLDEERKTTDAINYHNLGYIAVSKTYARDAFGLIARFPGTYAASVANGLATTFRPPSTYVFLKDNRAHVIALDRAYNLVTQGSWPDADAPADAGGTGDASSAAGAGNANANSPRAPGIAWLHVLLYPGVVIFAARSAWRERRSNAPRASTLAFCAFNIAYVIVLGNLLDNAGEGMRFRFLVEPTAYALAAALISDIARRRNGSRAA